MSADVHDSPPRGESAPDADAHLPDIDWTLLPPGTQRSRFSAPSGDLAVTALGDPRDPRVVLVPGATGSKEDFTLLAPLLAESGYFVQSFDMAGQFESAHAAPPPGGRYTYDVFVDDLLSFLESGPTAHVLGYSFAGIVAELALVARPDLFLSLTLLTAPPQTGQSFRGIRGIGPLSWIAPPRIGAALMIWGIVTNKNKVPPGRITFVRARFEKTNRESVVDIIRLMRTIPDVRAAVSVSHVPVLVATGTRDLWPTRLHRSNARALGARLVVFRTGHSPCETAPHQLASAMIALFTENSSPSTGTADTRE